MLPEKEVVQISKFLSLVLRHRPEKINIALDENGWTDVTTLIERAHKHGIRISLETLELVVANNSKKRFAFNADRTKIRASQGHSVAVELGYTPVKPQAVLYHGTSEKAIASILATGLQKQNRHHVHLSIDKFTAVNVGKRYGQPVVLQIDAAAMYNNGFTFYLSENQVWLTDFVPVTYLQVLAK